LVLNYELLGVGGEKYTSPDRSKSISPASKTQTRRQPKKAVLSVQCRDSKSLQKKKYLTKIQKNL